MNESNVKNFCNFNTLGEIGNDGNIIRNVICYNECLKNTSNLSAFFAENLFLQQTEVLRNNKVFKKDANKNLVKSNFEKWKSSLHNIAEDEYFNCDIKKNCNFQSIFNGDINTIFNCPNKEELLTQENLNEFNKKDNNLSIPQKNVVKQDINMKSRSEEFSHNFCENQNYIGRNIQINCEKKVSDNMNFKTARDELVIQNYKKFGRISGECLQNVKKSLGTKNILKSGFVLPVKNDKLKQEDNIEKKNESALIDERMSNIDPKMVELIENEIITNLEEITWNDIAGLEYAKSVIKEVIIWPLLRPDLFIGIRRPPKGILFFGPPGTGKTLIGKCIASQSKSKFFCISASSLTSKWIGEGEKMVRALFVVAAANQPSVIFIDEIDSLLSQRSETEHESSRRLKTEFLVQLDGAATSKDDQILIIGATNRPQELDEAARRRFVRRLYIPLPDENARIHILENLLKDVRNELLKSELQIISKMTKNYSGADIASLCQEACMEPLRAIPMNELLYFDKNNLRPVSLKDFEESVKKIRPSVSIDELNQYIDWDKIYGSGSF